MCFENNFSIFLKYRCVSKYFRKITKNIYLIKFKLCTYLYFKNLKKIYKTQTFTVKHKICIIFKTKNNKIIFFY